jgi:hypothetical protein
MKSYRKFDKTAIKPPTTKIPSRLSKLIVTETDDASSV